MVTFLTLNTWRLASAAPEALANLVSNIKEFKVLEHDQQ